VITDAFGLVAMVAMTPLITIQIMGLIFELKNKKSGETKLADEHTTWNLETDFEIIEL